jgi:hypothetical protein
MVVVRLSCMFVSHECKVENFEHNFDRSVCPKLGRNLTAACCLLPAASRRSAGGLLEARSKVAVAASGSMAAALQRPGSSSCSVRERCRSVAEARTQQLQTWERCRRVEEARKQQLQRLEALQERCRGRRAAVAASGSVAGALRVARAGDEVTKNCEARYGAGGTSR